MALTIMNTKQIFMRRLATVTTFCPVAIARAIELAV